MTNILTATFDTYDFLAVMMVSLPIFITIISSKRYNIFHGLVSFLFCTSLLAYVTSFDFFNSIASHSNYFLLVGSPLTDYINIWIPFDNIHIITIIYFGVWFVSHIIASKLRKNKRNSSY